MIIAGMQVRTSEFLTEAGTPYQVRRSWRERLTPIIRLNFPKLLVDWRPWQATRTVVPQVPRKEALMIGGVVYIHPALLPELRRLAQEPPR